jgi:hypothetical protein
VADEELVVRIIEEVGRRARHAHLDGLAHPVQVDARFADDLDALTGRADIPARTRSAQAIARGLGSLVEDQRAFNHALVDALHQLDHRARWQDDRIRELEAEVDELRRRLGR